MLDSSMLEFMVVCGNVLLVLLLLTEILNWSQIFSWSEPDSSPLFIFGYTDRNGPQTWKEFYPENIGNNQSPINIATKLAVVVQPSEPLRWNGYHIGCMSMTIANKANTVTICTFWENCAKPTIQGGPLNHSYEFHMILFHWGPSNEEGSEHTLDYTRFPMELQAIHVKRGLSSPHEAIAVGEKDGIAIVSCFFQITQADNPYLDPVVTNLWQIAEPGSKANIPEFPLEWILPPFERGYYSYNGSLTQPPCNEIVTWIIQPEPIAISTFQVSQFRKIHSIDGPVMLNCRPVQKLNERDVYFHE